MKYDRFYPSVRILNQLFISSVGRFPIIGRLFDLGNTFVILFQFSVAGSSISPNNFIAPQKFFKVPRANSPLSRSSL
jgi:hypothetical protein